ncbi:MAG TPA: peptidoglycan DD-metalloendopeptidase family protein [Puia sp.]|nr:peptidoglycan DD-metalloendopeptidase family protein [Puia sp.]
MIRLVTLLILAVLGIIYWFYRPSYGYFRPPLDRSLQLAANFGELREGHFHMGLDIRTGGKEGLPVYAAADGYISHLSTAPDGLGNALFITHSNGLISVYGHLQRFADSLDDIVRQRQYAMQSWQQEIDLPAEAYPVKKGDLIAYSGNTGSSQAPHLHFEIRDTAGVNRNPQLEGLSVEDDQPPVINGLYWYDRRHSTYMTRAQKIDITGRDGFYRTKRDIIAVNSPLISLGIAATDKSAANSHISGIFGATLWLDDSLIHAFSLRDLSSSDTRYINACIDYSKWVRSGIYVQHLSTLPGNHAPIFTYPGRDGLIHLRDTLIHILRIRTQDVQGNRSELTIRVRYMPACAAPAHDPLLFHTTAFSAGHYFSSGTIACTPGRETHVNGASFDARFTALSFYDQLPFHWQELPDTDSRSVSALIFLHDPTVPVHDKYFIQVRTSLSPNDPRRNRTVMQLTSGDSQYIVKGSSRGDWLAGFFSRLGILHLIIDTIAPDIHPYQWEEGQHFTRDVSTISIQCKDDLGLAASFRGEIDGHWAPFAQKGNIYTYTFDETCPPGAHKLSITAVDVAGNKAEKEIAFIRE